MRNNMRRARSSRTRSQSAAEQEVVPELGLDPGQGRLDQLGPLPLQIGGGGRVGKPPRTAGVLPVVQGLLNQVVGVLDRPGVSGQALDQPGSRPGGEPAQAVEPAHEPEQGVVRQRGDRDEGLGRKSSCGSGSLRRRAACPCPSANSVQAPTRWPPGPASATARTRPDRGGRRRRRPGRPGGIRGCRDRRPAARRSGAASEGRARTAGQGRRPATRSTCCTTSSQPGPNRLSAVVQELADEGLGDLLGSRPSRRPGTRGCRGRRRRGAGRGPCAAPASTCPGRRGPGARTRAGPRAADGAGGAARCGGR